MTPQERLRALKAKHTPHKLPPTPSVTVITTPPAPSEVPSTPPPAPATTPTTARPAILAPEATPAGNLRQQALARIAALKSAKQEPVVTLELPAHQVQEVQDAGIAEPQEPETVRQLDKSEVTYADLSDEQKEAVRLAASGESFCLIGAAGYGKTTTTQLIAKELSSSGVLNTLTSAEETKVLKAGAPSIVFCSFTNQAVSNIKAALPENYKNNCCTIHKLLEYAPEYYEVPNSDGTMRTTMRYVPRRDAYNKIPHLTHIVVEEAGSVGMDLWDKLMEALPAGVVFIFLGDLNQIPPVFGDAILGYKLLELPVIELTKSYRTGKKSPILSLAHKILEGKQLSDKEVAPIAVPGELDLIRFKERVDPEQALPQMGAHLQSLVQKGEFNPEEDVVLIPYGKSFGSIELGKYIAQKCTELSGELTYEVHAGFSSNYYAKGDFVFYDKRKWRIVDIFPNDFYTGKPTRPASPTLDRWGVDSDEALQAEALLAQEVDVEALFHKLAAESLSSENDKAFHQASHNIVLEDCDHEFPNTTINQTGDISNLMLSYALTVHKAQGSEWGRVFCIFHHSHYNLNREILYTACTRARKYLRIYYSGEDLRAPSVRKFGDSIWQKGIKRQAIPGRTLQQKLEYFRNKIKAERVKAEIKRVKAEGGTFALPTEEEVSTTSQALSTLPTERLP